MSEENDLQKIFSIIEEHDIKPNGIPLGFPTENDIFISRNTIDISEG